MRSPDEVIEIVERPKRRLDRHVAPGRAANRPWTAGTAGGRHQGVVRPLAMGQANRLNRREIRYVETHVADITQARLGLAQSPVPSGLRSTRAREEFVPRAITGPW